MQSVLKVTGGVFLCVCFFFLRNEEGVVLRMWVELQRFYKSSRTE